MAKWARTLAWELDFWGRFRRAVESANASLDASIENYDDVLVLLLAEVSQQYMWMSEQRNSGWNTPERMSVHNARVSNWPARSLQMAQQPSLM